MTSISDAACNRPALGLYVIDILFALKWSGGVMRNTGFFAVLLAAVSVLPACSTMPSWTKPSVWYDQVTGDPQAVEKAAADDAAKAAKPAVPEADFPILANTPAAPAPGLTAAQQREIRDSLAADRASARAAVEAVKQIETPETRAAAAAKAKAEAEKTP